MSYVPIIKLTPMEEQEASGEIADLFDEIRLEMGAPYVGLAYRAMALSPATLASGWIMYRDFFRRATLPPALLFMIHYTISSARKCQYCSTGFKYACRSVGVDEAMLEALVHDLDAVAPIRTQEIIKFAVKCALDPQGLTEVDYDRVREQGLSDEELVEIIGWAAIAMYNDTISDSMKLGDLAAQAFGEA
jgi:uncharacterized peroxidase-related enzyme